MTVRGYSSPDRVSDALGQDFTSAQNQYCLDLIAAAEDWIDEYTHQTWAATTPILAERHRLEGPRIYLRVIPLASIEAVHQAPWYVGATPVPLQANSDYQLISGTTGEVRVAGYRYGEILVDYTPAVTPPPAITDACTRMVAARMGGSTDASGQTLPSDVKRVQVGGEWTVERFTAEEVAGEVQSVLSTLRLKQRVVLV